VTDLSDYLISLGLSPLLVGLVAGIIVTLALRRLRGGAEAQTHTVGTSSVPIRLSRELSAEQTSAVMRALGHGQKIEAIKLIRDATGLGLRESKDLAEQMEQAAGPTAR
jgi:ribosomal protein L7/L12